MLRCCLVRLQPLTLRISSRGTEKENRSKLAILCFLDCVISTNIFQTKVKKWNISEVLALACNFSFAVFEVHFGVQDDGYYLRMMILGCCCWEITSCCVAVLFVCNRLHCGSLLVGLKKKIGQNWQFIAFRIALSLLIFFKQKFKNGISQKFSRSLEIFHWQFFKLFWNSGWWILPAVDDTWLSLLGNDLVLRGFLVRLQPVTLRISSRGTEKENKLKLAKYCLWIALSLLMFFKQKF